MQLLATAKTSKALTVLVTCLLTMAAVLCLVHTQNFGELHGAEHGHHHTSSSSPHSQFDGACLLATIPARIMLVWFALSVLYIPAQVSYSLAPSFSPFIPPKTSARS